MTACMLLERTSRRCGDARQAGERAGVHHWEPFGSEADDAERDGGEQGHSKMMLKRMMTWPVPGV